MTETSAPLKTSAEGGHSSTSLHWRQTRPRRRERGVDGEEEEEEEEDEVLVVVVVGMELSSEEEEERGSDGGGGGDEGGGGGGEEEGEGRTRWRKGCSTMEW